MIALGSATDELLAALVHYGYPILALVLLSGAVGLPLPSGLVAVAAGGLAAHGELDLALTGATAVVSALSGDVVGYGIGRGGGRSFLERYGGWMGLSPARLARGEGLFARWGGVSLLLSRSLFSILGPAVNLLAGLNRYAVAKFLVFALLGRALWVGAYVGLGYGFGGQVEAAADFLEGIAGLLAGLAVAVAAAYLLCRRARCGVSVAG